MNKNMKRHVKIGDRIKVITGNEKGILGTILSVNTTKKVVTIDDTSKRIKYTKNREGGESKKLELPIPIHISNVMLWDEAKNMSSKTGYKIVNDKKQRYFKKSGNIV